PRVHVLFWLHFLPAFFLFLKTLYIVPGNLNYLYYCNLDLVTRPDMTQKVSLEVLVDSLLE
ncbi:unnamed protein product, partial [Allacma fusca]